MEAGALVLGAAGEEVVAAVAVAGAMDSPEVVGETGRETGEFARPAGVGQTFLSTWSSASLLLLRAVRHCVRSPCHEEYSNTARSIPLVAERWKMGWVFFAHAAQYM